MPGYVFSLAPHLEEEAKWLLQSIRSNTSICAEEIFIFLAESEKEQIESLSYFENNGNIIRGEIPNEEYPLSALHRALEIACEKSKNKYVVCLDTDTVVVQDFNLSDTDADLMAAFDNDLGSFWSRQESKKHWERLHEKYSISFENPIRWFNGGVVVVDTNSDFPQDWKKISNELYNSIQRDKYFSDMISLGILSNKYKFIELDEKMNYMQGIHLDPPNKNTEVIHYIDKINIYRSLFNPRIRNELSETDIMSDIDDISLFKMYYNLTTSYMKAFRSSHPNTLFASFINILDRSR
jgi:hypothetical protein